MQANPRIPNTDKEVFAMAWMIGYIGWAPDELVSVFPNESLRECPEFIPLALAHFWRQGYDNGVAFFSDHALDGDE